MESVIFLISVNGLAQKIVVGVLAHLVLSLYHSFLSTYANDFKVPTTFKFKYIGGKTDRSAEKQNYMIVKHIFRLITLRTECILKNVRV